MEKATMTELTQYRIRHLANAGGQKTPRTVLIRGVFKITAVPATQYTFAARPLEFPAQS